MPKLIKKEEIYHLFKVLIFVIIFTSISAGVNYLIYGYNQSEIFVYLWYIILTPIVVCSVISHILIKNRIYSENWNIAIFLLYSIFGLVGVYTIKILKQIPDGADELLVVMFFVFLGSGISFLITNSIIKFIANKFVKISLPIHDELEKNTLIYNKTFALFDFYRKND